MFLGSSEKAGSGTDKILHGWEKQNWKKPYIMERSRPNKVVLTMPLESLMDEHVIEALNLHFGKKMEGLSRQQLTALALAYSEEEITNERLQHALDMHRADITTMLSDMCAQQLLESYGYGRGTKYRVYGINIGVPRSNMALNMDTSEGNMDSSSANMALNMDTSGANMDSSLANMESKGEKRALPKKYSKELLRELIVAFCKEWRTADEIATQISRDTKYIKNFVLPKMTDVLEKMYESIPNHPRQKYRARQKEE